VRSDVDERVRESRKNLEAEINVILHEASAIADRALARSRDAQAAGVPGVQAALARLDSSELELKSSISLSGPAPVQPNRVRPSR
jgi:hypothetical protein